MGNDSADGTERRLGRQGLTYLRFGQPPGCLSRSRRYGYSSLSNRLTT